MTQFPLLLQAFYDRDEIIAQVNPKKFSSKCREVQSLDALSRHLQVENVAVPTRG